METLMRTHRGPAFTVASLVALVALFSPTAAAAPIVNIVTGASLSLQPSTSGSTTLQFTNAGNASQGINSITLALMFIQTSGSGVLTFDAWSKPAAPLVIGDPNAEYTPTDPPSVFQLNAPITLGGTDYFDYYSVQVGAVNGFNYLLAPAATANVGVMTFTSDGPGTWDMYVVNQAPQPGGLPVSLFQTADTTDFGFGNLAVGNGEYLKVGTITAVPEPSTWVAAGMAAAVGFSRYLRRRTRQ